MELKDKYISGIDPYKKEKESKSYGGKVFWRPLTKEEIIKIKNKIE